MNIEGIKGSIDLSTENVFSQLDALEGRLNKFAKSRGNDGDIIANEMKAIVNVIAGSQIEFADNLKKAFDQIETQHLKYGQKARRIEKDVTKALVAEMVSRNQAFAQSYAQTQQDYLAQLNKTNAAYEALTRSKINDRNERASYRDAQKAKEAEARADKELAAQAEDTFRRSMAQIKAKEKALEDQANARMIEFRASKKAAEEAARVAAKNQKAQEAAMRASLERRKKMFMSFAKTVGSIAKGIVWFPVIANQALQMFKSVGYTIKAIWDGTLGQIIKVGAEVEAYMVRLKVSTGSLIAAKETWAVIEKFASNSVYTFNDSVQSAVALLPVLRKGRQELAQWQPIIADIAAGFGLSYEEATSNFIKLYAAGAPAADLFRERGVLAALGFTPGVAIRGKESADVVKKAWESNLSVFRGAADELSKTWSGTINKIKDQWFLFVKDLGDIGIFSRMKSILNTLFEAFKKLRESGEPYQRFLVAISDLLDAAISRVVEFFGRLASGMKDIWIIGDIIENALMTKDEQRIKKLQERKAALVNKGNWEFMSEEELNEAPEEVKRIDSEILKLTENVNKLGNAAKTAFGAFAGEWEIWRVADTKFSEYEKNLREMGQGKLGLDPHMQVKEKFQGLKIDDAKEMERLQKVIEASAEVDDEIQANLRKARSNLIKHTQGEWAAFQNEVAAEGMKMQKSLEDKYAMAGDENPAATAASKVGELISSKLAGKIAEYKDDLFEMVKSAENEMKKLGMTDYEKSRFDIENEFSGSKWKGQSSEVQKEMAVAKQKKLDLLAEEEARKKNNESLAHEQTLRLALIPSWDSYGLKLAEISNEYNLAAQGATDFAIAEAELNKSRQTEKLDTDTVKNYREQLEELKFTTSQFGLSNLDKEVNSFNRSLDRLVNSDFAKKNPQLIADLKAMLELEFKQSQVISFSDGWTGAMQEIKNAMMTDGMAIKTFMTDIFSQLSSTLSDVFFKVFKGELKDAAAAFEAFADAIMKSIADIMANQIASSMVSGLGGIMGSLFHSGGIVGSGGRNGRKVSPLAFLGAQRYHTGGIAGLAPNEVPAILEKGERIIPVGGDSGGSAKVAVSIKNESGQDLKITKAKQSQDMSGMVIEIVVDAINRNRGGLRDMMGR